MSNLRRLILLKESLQMKRKTRFVKDLTTRALCYCTQLVWSEGPVVRFCKARIERSNSKITVYKKCKCPKVIYLVKLSVCCMNFTEAKTNRFNVQNIWVTHTQQHASVLPVWVDLQHGFVKLRDLSVDERLQRLLQSVIIPLQLSLVLLLVWTDQALVLPQSIFTPLEGRSVRSGKLVCDHVIMRSCVAPTTSWWSL